MKHSRRRARRAPSALRRGALGAAVAAVVAIGAGALLVGPAAFGFWTQTGAGSGAATSAVTSAVTLSPGAGGGDLLPGGSGTVTTVAANTATTRAHVVALVVDTSHGTNGFAVDAAHSGCDTSVLAFPNQTHGGSGWDVGASSSVTITIPASVTMTTAAAAACQGASITVYLKASQ
ncbi:hypothetical protein [Frondihabitans cladoniiphilus]|uniref:Ribosomally synthesized peptide with SipW-like signal peptide n=1 Tax=Frondihabitans cladoniiphilus TaxID=715785 RepID=A0ABP8W8Z8_9MICO